MRLPKPKERPNKSKTSSQLGAGVGAGCGGITMGLHLTAEHMQAKVAVADAGLFSKVL